VEVRRGSLNHQQTLMTTKKNNKPLKPDEEEEGVTEASAGFLALIQRTAICFCTIAELNIHIFIYTYAAYNERPYITRYRLRLLSHQERSAINCVRAAIINRSAAVT
jgi:hypothetical protein